MKHKIKCVKVIYPSDKTELKKACINTILISLRNKLNNMYLKKD